MHETSYQDSRLSVLGRYDAEECKSSEATLQPWQPALRLKAGARAVSAPTENKQPAPTISAEPALVAQAKQYIEDHYWEELSLATVSGALGTDECFLGQMFDKTTGVTSHERLVYVRVEKAKHLLLNPHYYFTEIASELGFESLGQFNEAFKKAVGESPRAYRARLPSRIGCVVEMG